MKISIFLEMQMSFSRVRAGEESKVFHECLEQAIAADRLEFHCVWVAEHHGLYEYSHSSAPEVFLGAVAARTEKILLGHGVVLLPRAYNHPIRVAERIATLDVLSKGRVRFGSGKSGTLVEQKAFGLNALEVEKQWLESLEEIIEMWSVDVYEKKGHFFSGEKSVPPIRVLPRPVTLPHPPLYTACSRPDSARLAGMRGLGALNFALGNFSELKEKVGEYRQGFRNRAATKWNSNESFVCFPHALVLDDDYEACELGYRGARYFKDALNAYYFSGSRPTEALQIDRNPIGKAALEEMKKNRWGGANGMPASYVIGNQDFAKEILIQFAESGVDEVALVMQSGTVPHEKIMASMEIISKDIIPFFRNS
jgi:alkanesulfonate monooxygenase SsuD/methylene tetrahydromethanopterin reductase-like flavin-dependent oxidoreductase (luciferase family)